MSKIYLVRHGQSEANKMRLWGGDYPLTEKGRSDALEVPGRIPAEPEKIVSSALIRANMTAKIAYPGRDIEVNPAFNEIRFGAVEDTPMKKEDFAFYHIDLEGFLRRNGGEDPMKRAEEAVGAIRGYALKYSSTAIFTSEMLMRSILSVIQGHPVNDLSNYYIVNCGVITLEYDGTIHITDKTALAERSL